jgi:hypothetical protein
LKNLEKLTYKEGDSIHLFLAKWDALSLKARVKDVVYRQMLLGVMPRAVIERLQLNEPAKDDRGFRDQLLRAGKTSEHWHHHRLADRPRVTTSRPEHTTTRHSNHRIGCVTFLIGHIATLFHGFTARSTPSASVSSRFSAKIVCTVRDGTAGRQDPAPRRKCERPSGPLRDTQGISGFSRRDPHASRFAACELLHPA